MAMNETPTLMVAWLGGAALGAIFFGGLWWSVKKGVSSKRPALWFGGSLLVRLGIALPGLYFISGGRWERLLLALLGFSLARPLVARLTRPPGDRSALAVSGREGSHAP